MPALRLTSIWPRPLPMVFGSPALKSLGESCLLAAFSRKTCSAAFALSSLADSISITSPRWSYAVCVSWKSWRVPTSRRAWSRALVSSAASNSETTSKENSATARVEDGVHGDHDRSHRQSDTGHGREREQRSDSKRTLV